MKFEFSSQLDPVTKEPIDLKFDKNDFRKIEDKSYAQALFKSAANSMIKAFKNQSENVRKGMSIKYQVLSDETAMIGIIKQKDKASGDLKTFEQKLQRVKRPVAPPPMQKQSYAKAKNVDYSVQTLSYGFGQSNAAP